MQQYKDEKHDRLYLVWSKKCKDGSTSYRVHYRENGHMRVRKESLWYGKEEDAQADLDYLAKTNGWKEY